MSGQLIQVSSWILYLAQWKCSKGVLATTRTPPKFHLYLDLNQEPSTPQQSPYRQRHHRPKMCKCLLNCGVNGEKTFNTTILKQANLRSVWKYLYLCFIMFSMCYYHWVKCSLCCYCSCPSVEEDSHDFNNKRYFQEHIPLAAFPSAITPPAPHPPTQPWWPILFRTPIFPPHPCLPAAWKPTLLPVTQLTSA